MPGKHTIVFDFEYDGIGFGLGGRGTLKVDGKAVDSKRVPKTLKFMFSEDETFDVGVDTRTRSTTATTRCRSGSPASSTS